MKPLHLAVCTIIYYNFGHGVLIYISSKICIDESCDVFKNNYWNNNNKIIYIEWRQ